MADLRFDLLVVLAVLPLISLMTAAVVLCICRPDKERGRAQADCYRDGSHVYLLSAALMLACTIIPQDFMKMQRLRIAEPLQYIKLLRTHPSREPKYLRTYGSA